MKEYVEIFLRITMNFRKSPIEEHERESTLD